MVAGRVRHWKHGWIPVSPEAKAYVAGKGPNPTGGKNTVPMIGSKVGELQKEIEDNGGFTYDPKRNKIIRVGDVKGFAVAIPGTEHVVGEEKVNGEDITREEFAQGVADVIMQNGDKFAKGAKLGGWYSPERNQYMVEITEIFPDREAAIKAGRERNQEAIFDLETGENIDTGGTGDAPITKAPLSTLTRPMTPEEKAAAKYYTGPGYKPLNAKLRSGEAPPPPPGSVGAYMSKLDTLLASSKVDKDTTVYRGIKSYPGFPDHLAPGTLYADPGYMSTAVSDGPPENYQADIQMSIHVPSGATALDLNAYGLSHHPDERELLLPHGAQLQVIHDVLGADGKRMISLELVAGEGVRV